MKVYIFCRLKACPINLSCAATITSSKFRKLMLSEKKSDELACTKLQMHRHWKYRMSFNLDENVIKMCSMKYDI